MTPEFWCLAVGLAGMLGTLAGYAMGRAFGYREGESDEFRRWEDACHRHAAKWDDPDNEEE